MSQSSLAEQIRQPKLPPTVLHAGTAWLLSECGAHLPLQRRQCSDPLGPLELPQHLPLSLLHRTMWLPFTGALGVLVAADFPIMRASVWELLALEGDRARECYRAGEELIPLVNEDSQPGLWVLIAIYSRLLEKITSRQYDVFTERVRLTVPEKLTVLGKGFLKRLV